MNAKTIAGSHIKTVPLPSGDAVPVLGMGTWHLGDHAATRDEELATLRLGLDLGVTLIDTAEMYGTGRAEKLVAEAIAGRREKVFLVDKVRPSSASRRGTITACHRSLRRLQTDCIDLYLLHWRGAVPLAETLEGFLQLQRRGDIRHYGVSNLSLEEMQELQSIPGGADVQTDQVLYNLARRRIEWDLLPWLREHHMPLMAYSPLDEARLLHSPDLARFAHRHGRTPAQAALGWLLAKDDLIVLPKTSCRERLKENLGALEHPLTRAQLMELERVFPPPSAQRPLELI